MQLRLTQTAAVLTMALAGGCGGTSSPAPGEAEANVNAGAGGLGSVGAGIGGSPAAAAAGTSGVSGSSAGGADAASGGSSNSEGGSAGTGTSGGGGAAGSAGTAGLAKFSFFVTSFAALQRLSGSADGFGGDLRFGQTGAGAGLRGADMICASVAESSLPGAGVKGWRAFLSAANDGTGKPVNAIDRVGSGPWYDRLGRLFGNSTADIKNTRPANADAAIKNDFPNEDGVPNHQPDPTAGAVDNHDMLTGSGTAGQLYDKTATCLDWTSAIGNIASEGKPRVGHSWPRSGGGMGDSNNWMSALTESGCKAGANLLNQGGPLKDAVTVGSGGGYGGFFCFALTP